MLQINVLQAMMECLQRNGCCCIEMTANMWAYPVGSALLFRRPGVEVEVQVAGIQRNENGDLDLVICVAVGKDEGRRIF